ncbi:hypothetical protein [Micromonospora sp. WMMD980]|uniref:hypothetical protein n=1 Tax=Micromonospora sp. WMMD980 TaxID=3016088 RepID=UPI0024161DBA|nr:hypothetical protein [Micromonospora sp. WMMD980]MDG4800445.1 hypothetical protein [Micromonospora sp. WMMD980]
MRPRPGDLLRVDGRASVQFGGDRALTFRVVAVGPELTYTGWTWLTGYVLGQRGVATAKREIFVQLTGLRPAEEPVPPRRTGRVAQPQAQSNRVRTSASVASNGRAAR